ncbi:DNA polymerase epsilon subunit 4 isoform X2 [Osmia lignaria lignaria]|uniref:DNA polymerase epsilon subunit 4 isoform X2 n=1 Tax=Osmia lignaria lignaria TaxID=1437193 RepID=UPI001478B4BE|nr:DNA polymerase epsilon subunit 4 isoform X2 [Osmia lignaria]
MANFENEGNVSDRELNESNAGIGGENSQDSQEEVENNMRTDEEQKEKLVRLPLGRIKTIIKMDPEVNMINQEAVFLIAKSTILELMSSNAQYYHCSNMMIYIISTE